MTDQKINPTAMGACKRESKNFVKAKLCALRELPQVAKVHLFIKQRYVGLAWLIYEKTVRF